MNFVGLHTKISEVIVKLDELVLKSAMENETIIADLQTKQMSLGQTNKGTLIEPELRSDEYSRLKKATGGQAPLYTPDLHDTGAYYRGMYAKMVNKSIVTDSTDEKADDLKFKYANILGLNETFLVELKSYNLPIVLINIRHELRIS